MIFSGRNISKSYQMGDVKTQVFSGLDFDIYEGEFLCLVGQSGCGKSTLLNLIGGMDSADEGSLRFMGQELYGADRRVLTDYRRRNIGFIFQAFNLMPNLTAKQNLDLIAELVEAPMRTDDALELVGMYPKRNHYPSQLSGGQQQRVSIARALVKRPKLILADEPTAALDYATGIEVLTALENVLHEGTTMVMVTHNEEITKMADRTIRLRGGKIHEIRTNPNPLHAAELDW